MTVAVEQIAKVALDRVKAARAEADEITGYSTPSEHLFRARRDLDIAIELLSLIVPPPARPAVTIDVTA